MAEISATKLETNENFIGVRINDCKIRNIQSCRWSIVQDVNSMTQALNTVCKFCKHVGYLLI